MVQQLANGLKSLVLSTTLISVASFTSAALQPAWALNGEFGKINQRAVIEFQENKELSKNGGVETKTIAVVNKGVNKGNCSGGGIFRKPECDGGSN